MSESVILFGLEKTQMNENWKDNSDTTREKEMECKRLKAVSTYLNVP